MKDLQDECLGTSKIISRGAPGGIPSGTLGKIPRETVLRNSGETIGGMPGEAHRGTQ